jgi:hypothetical protein
MHVSELCENQHIENHPLLLSTHEFLSVVRHSPSSFSETGTQYLPLMLGSTCEFHENWPRGGCIFLLGINVIICVYVCVYTHILPIPENHTAFSKQGMPCTMSWSTALAVVHLDKAATSGMVERMCINH